MIKVLIVSGIRLFCEGVADILERAGGLNIVGTAICLDEAVCMLQVENPQVVVLDMTTKESMSIVEYINSQYASTKIISLAVKEMDCDIAKCVDAGITCYVSKDASTSELLEAINKANRNEFYCSQTFLVSMFYVVNSIWKSRSEVNLSRYSEQISLSNSVLTRREVEIAGLLTSNLSNKQIARNLSIEICTVKNHVHNILVKLGVKKRSDVADVLNKSKNVLMKSQYLKMESSRLNK